MSRGKLSDAAFAQAQGYRKLTMLLREVAEMSASSPTEVLHAIVGHKLPVYFLNAVRSVRACADEDDLIVADNASGLPDLCEDLATIEAGDPRVHLVCRPSNDLSSNQKVGGLYDAYREIVAYALERDYRFLHLMQADMQMLWWNSSVIEKAKELFDRYPECVNIYTVALPRHFRDSADFDPLPDGVVDLCRYGLTDTGLYDLRRWRELNIAFHDREQAHGVKYRAAGMRVLYHPWPSVAQVPWPAVVRKGAVKGQEVAPKMPFLLRPLTESEVGQVRDSEGPVWLEDVCVPWGWVCLTPMWTTALESIDYWVFRWRDVQRRGLRAAWPRWERSGIAPKLSVRQVQRRPSLWQPVILPPWHELKRRILAR